MQASTSAVVGFGFEMILFDSAFTTSPNEILDFPSLTFFAARSTALEAAFTKSDLPSSLACCAANLTMLLKASVSFWSVVFFGFSVFDSCAHYIINIYGNK